MLSASPNRFLAAVRSPSLIVSSTYSWSRFFDLVIWWTTSIMSKSIAIFPFSWFAPTLQRTSDDHFRFNHTVPFVIGRADGHRIVFHFGDDTFGRLAFAFVVLELESDALAHLAPEIGQGRERTIQPR